MRERTRTAAAGRARRGLDRAADRGRGPDRLGARRRRPGCGSRPPPRTAPSGARLPARRRGDAGPRRSARRASGDGYVWTRKRATSPVECDVRIGERADPLRGARDRGRVARAITRTTRSGTGRPGSGARPTAASVGWNLVSGINDPPRALRARDLGRRRAIRARPGRRFEGLEAIAFDDGSRLEFSAECERRKQEKRALRPLLLPPAVRHASPARCPAASSSSAASA